MPLTRCVDQSHNTLVEFYEKLLGNESSMLSSRAKDMLGLLVELDTLFKEITVYAFTSHSNLQIISGRYTHDQVGVTVSAYGHQVGYAIRYIVPQEDNPPWEDAMIIGEARSLKKAVEMIVIAMLRSNLWKGNEKAEKILLSHVKEQ
ncbi:hypothetical protein [Lewinella cohaerens]|uniref:hypothetical protein n=1 Tax=Lewinella cohaerens TaxID=70995 RepID=UPI00035CAF4D|nr:hypothetical protein [Lewinella cohaerens]